MSYSLRPYGLYHGVYTVHGILQARILEWVAFPFSRESSQLRSPTVQADSLSAEPQGKPKSTGLGSLFLLQRIFPTQESNWCLLHCRRILYQLSYQGSPVINHNGKGYFKKYNLYKYITKSLCCTAEIGTAL